MFALMSKQRPLRAILMFISAKELSNVGFVSSFQKAQERIKKKKYSNFNFFGINQFGTPTKCLTT